MLKLILTLFPLSSWYTVISFDVFGSKCWHTLSKKQINYTSKILKKTDDYWISNIYITFVCKIKHISSIILFCPFDQIFSDTCSDKSMQIL